MVQSPDKIVRARIAADGSPQAEAAEPAPSGA
jgi:hypothetical protein